MVISPAGLELDKCAGETSNSCKRQTILSLDRMLHNDYDHKGTCFLPDQGYMYMPTRMRGVITERATIMCNSQWTVIVPQKD
jgi:hypothetical protein